MKKLIYLITILTAAGCQNFANVEGYTFTDDTNTEIGTSSDDNTVVGGTASDSNAATDTTTETGGDTQTGVGDTLDTNTGFDTIDDSSSSTATTDSDVDSDTNSSSDSGIADSDSNSETDTSNCVLKERRCDEVANQTQVCNAQGIWQNEQKCQYMCHNGFCTGECYPDQIRCDESTGVPQLCNTLGQWENQSACPQNALCAAGECVCSGGLTNCDNSCIDLNSSPEHCEQCGHSCLGGECIDGQCQPFVLTENLSNYTDLFISDNYIYIFERTLGDIHRIPKSGGVKEAIMTGNYSVTAVAISQDDTLYIADPPSLLTFTPGAAEMNEFASLSQAVKTITIKNATVFWDQQVDDHVEIYSRPTDKSAPPAIVSTYYGTLDEFTVCNDCIYIVGNSRKKLVQYCGQVGNNLLTSTNNLSLSPDASCDDSFLYYAARDEGIFRLSLENSLPNSLIANGVSILDMAVQDDWLYYIEGDAGGRPECTDNWGLYKANVQQNSAPLTIIPPPMNCPVNINITDDAIYWMNSDASSQYPIMKLAK